MCPRTSALFLERDGLGIKNIFDEDAPQVYDAANFSYDPRQHDPRGRLTYIGLNIRDEFLDNYK